ncbi:MAG: hypothetical protein ACP5H0_03895 [Caldisericum sp.]|uniref:hypothetical protein n=1 Tax=Caldisericum sp. TaxID=2499687 RepID=UPI003D1264C7
MFLKILKIDALTGIMVSYQNIFIDDYPLDIEKGNLQGAFLDCDHKVLYIPVTMDYDVAKDFGAEIVGIDAISGQIIMMTHRVEIYYPRITNEKTSVLEILSYGTIITLNINGKTRSLYYDRFSYTDLHNKKLYHFCRV